ncbi:MAG TPA: cysteine dioxygenase [Trebonia sp.]|nr:cysteine dioxygenase [Trebonia sp.]
MNTDLSVAPEIALLAAPLVPVQADPPRPCTDGRLAGDLTDLAAAPQRWWDLVRFDPNGPLRIPLPGAPGAWLLVVPPGAAAECDCDQATALAGEAVEASAAGAARPLRPGRVLVHGSRAPHRLLTAGHGYSVTLHATAATVRSE